MDIIIKAKDKLLKAREEVIDTQKQHIKELSKNRDLIEKISVTPVDNTITLKKKGEMTEFTDIKKRMDGERRLRPDMTRPPRSK